MKDSLDKLMNEQDILLNRIEESISITNLSNLDRMRLMDQIQECVEDAFFEEIQEARKESEDGDRGAEHQISPGVPCSWA